MSRILLLIILSFAASAAAVFLKKFNTKNFTNSGWSVPGHIDRNDFEFSDANWLAVIFSSDTCETCKPAVAESMKLSTLGIAVQEIPVETKKHLHQKYDIDAVPMLLLADEFGVVKSSHLGPVNFENAKESFESVLFDTPKS